MTSQGEKSKQRVTLVQLQCLWGPLLLSQVKYTRVIKLNGVRYRSFFSKKGHCSLQQKM